MSLPKTLMLELISVVCALLPAVVVSSYLLTLSDSEPTKRSTRPQGVKAAKKNKYGKRGNQKVDAALSRRLDLMERKLEIELFTAPTSLYLLDDECRLSGFLCFLLFGFTLGEMDDLAKEYFNIQKTQVLEKMRKLINNSAKRPAADTRSKVETGPKGREQAIALDAGPISPRVSPVQSPDIPASPPARDLD